MLPEYVFKDKPQWKRGGSRERRFHVYKEAPAFRPGPRERERRFRVYKEAPGFRPGLRGNLK